MKTILSLFIFFTKRFHTHKNTHKQTLTNKTELSKQKTTKAAFFMREKTSKGVKGASLLFSTFCACEIFL